MSTELIVAIRSPAGQKERRDAIRETWGKAFLEHGSQVLFVVSGGIVQRGAPQLKDDVLYTPGTDTHRDLTNRMIWLWSHLMTSCSFTHVLVMDDDCSVNVPFFMSLPWNEHNAWGHNSGGFLSGCAAVFSKFTVKHLNENMSRDDVVIGSVLTRAGIIMEHAGSATTLCSVRPWLPDVKIINESHAGAGGGYVFGDAGVAIQHYVRAPQEIIQNHLKLNN